MANFNPLSSTVSFDDLLKANKQAFDQIFWRGPRNWVCSAQIIARPRPQI
jgi:hypothetical protein